MWWEGVEVVNEGEYGGEMRVWCEVWVEEVE